MSVFFERDLKLGGHPHSYWKVANRGKENGEFIIVLDSQDRENEGDLIIAAESITDAQMAFLVRYSRFVYCPPLPTDTWIP